MQSRVAFGFGQEQELAKLHVKMSKATTEDLKAFAKIVEVERGGTKVLLLCGSDGTTGPLWSNMLVYKARLHATDQTCAPEHNAPCEEPRRRPRTARGRRARRFGVGTART